VKRNVLARRRVSRASIKTNPRGVEKRRDLQRLAFTHDEQAAARTAHKSETLTNERAKWTSIVGGNSELEGQIPRVRGGAADAATRLRRVHMAGPSAGKGHDKYQVFVIAQ